MSAKTILMILRGIWTWLEYFFDSFQFKIFGLGDMEEEPVVGRVAIVTGSNTGLGKQVVKELADRGATVILGNLEDQC